jgi:Family of unknown function (DUF5320)
MAGRNGTGPTGEGPLTGRGLGNCNPKTNTEDNQDINNQDLPRGRGLGLGNGRGPGRGMGRGLGQGGGRGMGRGQGGGRGRGRNS